MEIDGTAGREGEWEDEHILDSIVETKTGDFIAFSHLEQPRLNLKCSIFIQFRETTFAC